MTANNPVKTGVANTQPSSQQWAGTWIFGSLLLGFYLYVFLYGPSVLPPYKIQMLGILSALLGGLFSLFLTGTIVTSLKGELAPKTQVAIQATGGIGVAFGLLIWWYVAAPIQSSPDAARQLLQQDLPAASANPQGTSKTGAIQTTSQIRSLATQLASSDPEKYGEVRFLARKEVPIEALTRAVASMSNPPVRNPGQQNLEMEIGSGIGPFRLGLTPAEVNAGLPQPFGDVSWATLQVAGEYKSTEVRYFWVPAIQFQSPEDPESPFRFMKAWTPCWKGQTYITFLFTAQKLSRISVRLYPDCQQRVQLLRQLGGDLGIAGFNASGPIAFQDLLSKVTAVGYVSTDAATFDLFSNGSPQF